MLQAISLSEINYTQVVCIVCQCFKCTDNQLKLHRSLSSAIYVTIICYYNCIQCHCLYLKEHSLAVLFLFLLFLKRSFSITTDQFCHRMSVRKDIFRNGHLLASNFCYLVLFVIRCVPCCHVL